MRRFADLVIGSRRPGCLWREGRGCASDNIRVWGRLSEGGQGVQDGQVLEFWLGALKLQSAFLGWKSKVIIVLVSRAP